MLEKSEDRRKLWQDFQIMMHEMYKAKGLVYPNAQDAASFTVQESVEVVDVFLRRKNYIRNNPKPSDKVALMEEISQVMLMICMTAYLEGINPFEAFYTLFVKYTTGDSNEKVNTKAYD